MARSLASSVLLHLVVVAALLAAGLSRPVREPTLRSIDVQLLAPAQAVPEPISEAQRPAPAGVDQVSAPAQQDPLHQSANTSAGGSELTQAKELYAGKILSEPASREVRETLPLLEPRERLTQLCNIEALEQIRLAQQGSDPDAMSDAAFGETEIKDLTLRAPAAAYRSKRNWFRVEFECTIAPDYGRVTDFRFRVGTAVPQEEWESHDLIAEDEDE